MECRYDQIPIPVLSAAFCSKQTDTARRAYARRVQGLTYHVIEYSEGSLYDRRFGIVFMGRKYGEHQEYFDTSIFHYYATREEALLIAQLAEYFWRRGDRQALSSLWDVDHLNAYAIISRPDWPRDRHEEQIFAPHPTIEQLNALLEERADWHRYWPSTLEPQALSYLFFQENGGVDWQMVLFHLLATVAIKCEDGRYRSFGHSLQTFCNAFGLPWHLALNERLVPRIVKAHPKLLLLDDDTRPWRWIKDVQWRVDPAPYAHAMPACRSCQQRPLFFQRCQGLTYGSSDDSRERFMSCPFEAFPCPNETLPSLCCRCREIWLEEIFPEHSVEAIEAHITRLLSSSTLTS